MREVYREVQQAFIKLRSRYLSNDRELRDGWPQSRNLLVITHTRVACAWSLLRPLVQTGEAHRTHCPDSKCISHECILMDMSLEFLFTNSQLSA